MKYCEVSEQDIVREENREREKRIPLATILREDHLRSCQLSQDLKCMEQKTELVKKLPVQREQMAQSPELEAGRAA